MKMHIYDKLLFVLFGAAFWVIGTIWYELRGPQVFESTSVRYWINFAVTPILTAVICILLLRWRHVPAAEWASAALLIALPGMFGEAALLSRFAADLREGAFERCEMRGRAARAILWRLTMMKLREGNPQFLADNGFGE